MLTQICQYLRNWFDRDRIIGDFAVTDHSITAADGSALPLVPGQYFRIIGSLFNDGVHKLGDTKDILTDEPEFNGAVWSMAVPPAVIALAADIEQWCKDNQDAILSPYQSESFGGYSYSFGAINSVTSEYTGPSWQSQFSPQLSPWRKI